MSKDLADRTKADRVEEMFRQGDDVLQRRDRAAGRQMVAKLWHEDCEWIPLIAAVEGEGTYRGREGVLEFYEDLTSSFEFHYRDARFEEMGDAVVFLSTMELKGRESGVEIERELGVVYLFEGELIRRGWAYDSHAAALAAAGELAG